MKKYAIVAALALAACATKPVRVPEPVVVPVQVAVAVEQPCVPDTLKAKPVYVDSKSALVALGNAIDERLQLLYAGRAQREARLAELEPIVEGCPRGKSK